MATTQQVGTVLAMPELPEVENVLRQLRPVLEGCCIDSSWSSEHRNYRTLPPLVGARVSRLNRRGKWLIVEMADGRDLLLHLGMTGALLLDVEEDRHDRVRLALAGGRTLTLRDPRGFGRALVVPHGDYSRSPNLSALGQEPLPGLDEAEAVAGLRSSSSPVKATLLSGKVLAGVGNYIADEALWEAKVHPEAKALSPAAARRVVRAVVAVVGRSIAAGGSTFRDYRRPDGTSGGSQLLMQAYGRSGLPCNRCRTALKHASVAGRGTTWCPLCQRR